MPRKDTMMIWKKERELFMGVGPSKCVISTARPLEKQSSTLNLISQILDFRVPFDLRNMIS